MNEMIIIAGLVAVGVGLVIYSLLPNKHKEEEDHLKRRMAGKRQQKDDLIATLGQPKRESAARQVLEKVAPYAMKPVMPKNDEEMSTLRQKLSVGGFRHESASRYFLTGKTIAGLSFAGLALMFALGKEYEAKQIFGVVAMGGGFGFLLPNMWLSIAQKQRIEKIRNGLPDSLDLMVVSVESGLALDAAIQRVGDEMRNVHPELSEELQIATLEAQMGVPRSEALENMARRCGVQEMSALVAIITQAEKFGTSISRALRNQADSLRVKRRLKAEERAQKTTVKLMLPLILFIFPSIFVVLLGPAVLKIIKVMGEGGALSNSTG